MIFSTADDSTDTDHVFAVMNFLYWDILIILNAKILLEETDVKTKESKKLQLFLERSKDGLSALNEIRSGILL